MTSNKTIKYLSLFSGIGGFEYGMDKSNFNFECIWFSEIDKYAKNIYKRHYKNHKDLGDATKIRTSELPDFDLLVGGFPCQAFSIAGKRRGFNDTRGTLFFEIARILHDKRPKYFLLENVRGLLSHDKGKTFQTIVRVLAEEGYDVRWEVLNSKNFGVPQNRERVFIKGYFRADCGGEVLSFKGEGREVNDTRLNKLNNAHQAQTIYDINGVSCTLSANGGGDGGKTGLYKIQNNKDPVKIINSTKKGYLECNIKEDGIITTRTGGAKCRGRVQKKSTGSLDTSGSWGVLEDEYRIRRLIPLECERLQGFPDNWTKKGIDGSLISDTQRYKCIGNAVTTSVITHIINDMFANK